MSEEFTTRPVVMGRRYALTSGHYLATLAGSNIFEKGGNAIDACGCMAFCLAVLEPHLNSIGGECPVLIYSAKEERVISVSGQGCAPKEASIQKFRNLGINIIPGDGLLATTVPSMVSTWIKVLKEYGNLKLNEVLNPAILLAEDGFPAYQGLINVIKNNSERILKEWNTTAKIFLPDGELPIEGQIIRQMNLAKVLMTLSHAAKFAADRDDGFDKARDQFYEGWIAKRIVDFARGNKFRDASGKENSGLIDLDDLVDYETKFEEPLMVDFRGLEVFKNSTWTQGPVLLQMLRILEGFDLEKLGHNTVDYIHLLIETIKLAYADREKYYGDPDFDKVPIKHLLSREYAEQRRNLINMDNASSELEAGSIDFKQDTDAKDTTHLDAVDKEGNMVSATQSGAWIQSSPVIEGLGFPLGTRMQVFYLDEKRNNCLQPGKRPRTTLSPSLVLRNNKPYLAFGTLGGELQDQLNLQFLFNFAVFEMNLQKALDEPTFYSQHFPNSFYPRDSYPKRVVLEDRISGNVIDELAKRGHDVKSVSGWSNGRVSAVHKNNILMAGASPRKLTAYALAW